MTQRQAHHGPREQKQGGPANGLGDGGSITRDSALTLWPESNVVEITCVCVHYQTCQLSRPSTPWAGSKKKWRFWVRLGYQATRPVAKGPSTLCDCLPRLLNGILMDSLRSCGRMSVARRCILLLSTTIPWLRCCREPVAATGYLQRIRAASRDLLAHSDPANVQTPHARCCHCDLFSTRTILAGSPTDDLCQTMPHP